MSVWVLLLWWAYATHSSAGAASSPFIVLQWPELVEVLIGEDARLNCDVKELYSPCSSIVWLQVPPGSMTLEHTDLAAVETHPSLNIAGMCSTTILNASVGDSGMYYCTVQARQFVHIGNGSKVIVKDATASLSIEIITALSSVGSVVPLQCLVSGDVNAQVQVFWIINGQEKRGHTKSALISNADGVLQYLQNQVLVSAEDWEGTMSFTCVVELFGKVISKTLNHTEAEMSEAVSGVCHMGLWLYTALGITCTLLLIMLVVVKATLCLRKYQEEQKIEGEGQADGQEDCPDEPSILGCCS